MLYSGEFTLTTQEEKAHQYEKRLRGIELRKRIATFQSKMRDHSRHWSELGRAFEKPDDLSFRIEESKIKAVHSSFVGREHVTATVEMQYFQCDEIVKLLEDFESTRKELSEIRKYLDEIGDPLTESSSASGSVAIIEPSSTASVFPPTMTVTLSGVLRFLQVENFANASEEEAMFFLQLRSQDVGSRQNYSPRS